MIFTDLQPGESVFVDANILTYHFQPHPILGPACTGLLEHIERQELRGLTSCHILTEVAHRLMTMEACSEFGWPISGIAQRLKRHPAEVQRLVRFRRAIEEVPLYGIEVLAVPPQLVAVGAAISQEMGLLSNDALVVAVMRRHGLNRLVSHDADFDRVPGLLRYAPC
jgi:predicted nucleic acid-binding protein